VRAQSKARSRFALAWLVGFACVALPPGAPAQPAPAALFASDDTLEVALSVPWAELRKPSATARRHPTVVEYVDAAGQRRQVPATVEVRGINRRRVCRFPPYRLRFSAADTAGTVFAGVRALKVVTHCAHGRRWSQYPVLEFLAYRMFNTVTGHSYAVRPLQVTYREAGGDGGEPRFAFVIEATDDMARRNGRRHVETGAFAARDYDAAQMGRFMLFQLMIGNTDWEILGAPGDRECCHNVRVTRGAGPDGLVAVPYDFDASGFVDAHYSVPDGRLPIHDVTERLYRGFCLHGGALEAARSEFLAHRGAVLALVQGESRLEARRKAEAVRYLEAFFALLSDDGRYARQVTGACRT
jgi:hypothetical protein